MKKLACLMLMVLIVLTFSCCKNNENGFSATGADEYFNTFENFENTFTEIYVKEKNYEIRHSKYHVGDFYTVYDNYGNLLDKGYHGYRGSFNISQKDNVVTLEYGFGGTYVFPKYRMYDIEKGMVSRYFEGPIALKDNMIASFIIKDDRAYLTVQDIFDTDVFCKEFSINMDKFYHLQIEEVYFADDGKKVFIKHYEDDYESDIVEKSFDLY
ncbi:MAG: hypothetical protein IJA44_05720 [Clostridia bacterium]|nr:hypothetical protein [Clostridia bacterium]